ncbi:MAG: hypothetical protein BGO57_02565 [Sphingomonadales bacterium 63-6]|nr:MAG: hypothetical protein BGO57_02565 [Sphingomonadales bacterium 63-6]
MSIIPTLEHCFSVRLRFPEGPRVRFQPAFSDFRRGFVSVAGGDVSGPKLQGKVVPNSGGDWPLMWGSGLIEFEAHYMLEADDGTPIYIHNRGIAYSSPETLRKIEAGEPVDPAETYLRITPRFEVPAGKHEWLARTVFVGTAERQGNETQFEYYAVR